MESVKEFFLRKKVGFYVGAVAALLSLICTIVYASGFTPNGELEEYISAGVWVFTLLSFLSYVGLSLFKQTSKYAAAAMGVLAFIALLLFIKNGYMYFSIIFYGTVSLANFFGMNTAYLISMLSLLFIVILSNVAIYLKHEKAEEQTKKSEEAL